MSQVPCSFTVPQLPPSRRAKIPSEPSTGFPAKRLISSITTIQLLAGFHLHLYKVINSSLATARPSTRRYTLKLALLCASTLTNIPSERMAPPDGTSSEAEKDTCGGRTTGRGFLDLPMEIKVKIYACYIHVPKIALEESPSQDDEAKTLMDPKLEESRQIKQTRKSLLLVSRQVHEDWAPTFYSTTTIIVNPKLSSSLTASRADFGNVFKGQESTKVSQITKIKYKKDLRSKDSSDEVSADMQRMKDFIEEYYGRLPALRKITFYAANTDPSLADLICSGCPVGESKCPATAFYSAGLARSFDNSERNLLLWWDYPDWTSRHRKMHWIEDDRPRYLYLSRMCYWTSLKSVFRKVEKQDPLRC